MLNRKELYSRAEDILRQRRLTALDICDLHKKEVYQKDDRFEQIDAELSSIGITAAKAVLMGSSAKKALEELKDRSLSLQNEYQELLSKYGYDKEYIEPDFRCKKCNDTGRYENGNRTLVCDCLKKIVIDETCRELSKELPLHESRFENFSLEYYDNDESMGSRNPRKRMSRILDYCLSYADGFCRESKNILMIGSTGLGKTHLSLSIANVVLRKGYSVIYITASDIINRYERVHFDYRYNAEEELTDSLVSCDLLIIDDLGTEFNNKYSSSVIYNLFNARLQRKMPIIINTNITLSEIESLYSQRFVSRIMGNCERLDFLGNDVRQKKSI